MILFWLIAAALTGLVLLLIVPPLLRAPEVRDDEQRVQDIEIARGRLDELDRAHESGALEEEDYRATRLEIEQALALDLAQLERARVRTNADAGRLTPSALILPVAIAFVLPAAAGAIYLLVGEPAVITGNTEPRAVADAEGQQSIDIMIDQLKARLAENPEDARGWGILARTSMQLQRYDDAVLALGKLNALSPGDADVLVQYADALAMQSGGVLQGKPSNLLDQALKINPDQPQGLWLAGMAAEGRDEFENAMSYWTRLLPQLNEDPESRGELLRLMDNLVQRAGSAGVSLNMPDVAGARSPSMSAAQAAAITVKVSLDPELGAGTAPDDTVFVFARAANGPPMPLAAARKRVSDLPFEVVLDDSGSMVPGVKLSSFDRVNVVARISKSGQPTQSSGDLEGIVESVSTHADAELDLVIARRVP